MARDDEWNRSTGIASGKRANEEREVRKDII
jgi:hypothetical protein